MRSTIKVLVVDDSALTRQLLTRALSVDPAIEIVGTARTGVEAIEKTHSLAPDVVTLDIEMPELTGLEALPHIIRTSPARVLILSSVDDPETTYAALDLGATDFVVKPASGFVSSLTELSEVLIKKIKTAYRVRPERRQVARHEELRRVAGVTGPAGGGPPGHLVAIAASTGGPPALEVVVSRLDPGLDASYMIVQHLPKGFTGSLARRLGQLAPIPVVEAEDGMPVERDTAYIAPHGRHMTVAGRRTIRVSLQDAPPVHGVRPAADPLFMSVAERVGKDSVGWFSRGWHRRGCGVALDQGGRRHDDRPGRGEQRGLGHARGCRAHGCGIPRGADRRCGRRDPPRREGVTGL